ncbi:hypothetical protein AWC13_18625 [Mycobacterium kubicae]|nr:hypothetical protein AWC13_18625 [Mycobacterium kubicae]
MEVAETQTRWTTALNHPEWVARAALDAVAKRPHRFDWKSAAERLVKALLRVEGVGAYTATAEAM